MLLDVDEAAAYRLATPAQRNQWWQGRPPLDVKSDGYTGPGYTGPGGPLADPGQAFAAVVALDQAEADVRRVVGADRTARALLHLEADVTAELLRHPPPSAEELHRRQVEQRRARDNEFSWAMRGHLAG